MSVYGIVGTASLLLTSSPPSPTVAPPALSRRILVRLLFAHARALTLAFSRSQIWRATATPWRRGASARYNDDDDSPVVLPPSVDPHVQVHVPHKGSPRGDTQVRCCCCLLLQVSAD